MESSQERKLYIPVGHGELHPAVRVEVVRSVLWPVGIVGLCGVCPCRADIPDG